MKYLFTEKKSLNYFQVNKILDIKEVGRLLGIIVLQKRIGSCYRRTLLFAAAGRVEGGLSGKVRGCFRRATF